MIKEFIERWEKNKHTLEEKYSQILPGCYFTIVKDVFDLLVNAAEDDYCEPDTSKIEVIDHGDYQGTKLYIVPENCYQPSNYWYVMVNYGSCSGCDTLEAILSNSDCHNELPTDSQVKNCMTLALHILQSIRKMYDE